MSGRFDEFQKRDCDVLSVSTDDIETHHQWLTTPPEDGGLGSVRFDLASDVDGAMARSYGVYLERQKVALRGLFIIDSNGVLQYQLVHSLSIGRSSEEVLRVLEAIQSGGLCPGERELGQLPINVAESLGPNRVLGQYQIESKIGSGAFGTVFRALDLLLDRRVALKVLRPNSGGEESLLGEARAAAALSHPNVCTLHGIDTSNGVEMIVMEYVEGTTLSELLEQGPLAIDQAQLIARQVASGMAAAHQAGIVHGDLKPGNLLVSENAQVKIMDFGLARRILPDRWHAETVSLAATTDSSGLAGTPGYMAPEVSRGGPPTPESDVFALGLIIAEMLSGRPTVSGSNIFEVLKFINNFDPATLAGQFPEPFESLLIEVLAPNPQQRTINMTDIDKRLA